MTLEEIRELLKLVMDSGVAELELQRGQNRVRIRRSLEHADREPSPAAPPPARDPVELTAAAASGPLPPQPAETAAFGEEEAELSDDPNLEVVKSPIVGTFYSSPGPGKPVFVKAGDRIKPGQVLCIIESMKLMNEIEAEVAGTIVKELASNAQPVEYGQGLYLIRKD